MSLGGKIAELRIKQNMSQEELANRLFVSRDLVAKWEKDKSRPNNEILNELCVLLSVRFGYFESDDECLERELRKCIPKGVDMSLEELTAVVNEFLKTLSEKERNIFVSRYFLAETPDQIGEKYCIGRAYIYVCLSRTRSKLYKYLNGEK